MATQVKITSIILWLEFSTLSTVFKISYLVIRCLIFSIETSECMFRCLNCVIWHGCNSYRIDKYLFSHKLYGKCMEISQTIWLFKISTHWLIVVKGFMWLWIWIVMSVVRCVQIWFPQYFISFCKMWFLHQHHEFVYIFEYLGSLTSVYWYPSGHAFIQTSYFQISW